MVTSSDFDAAPGINSDADALFVDPISASGSTTSKTAHVGGSLLTEGDGELPENLPELSRGNVFNRAWTCIKDFFSWGLQRIVALISMIFKKRIIEPNRKAFVPPPVLTVASFLPPPVAPKAPPISVLPPAVGGLQNLFAGVPSLTVGAELTLSASAENSKDIPEVAQELGRLIENLNGNAERLNKAIASLEFNFPRDLINLRAIHSEFEVALNEAGAIREDERFKRLLASPENEQPLRNALVKIQESGTNLFLKVNDPKNSRKIFVLLNAIIGHLVTKGKEIIKAREVEKTKLSLEKETKIKGEAETKDKADSERAGDSRAPIVSGLETNSTLIDHEIKEVLRIFRYLKQQKMIADNNPLVIAVFKLMNSLSLAKIKESSSQLFEIAVPKRDLNGLYNLGNSCYLNAGLKLFIGLLPELIRKELQRKVEILGDGSQRLEQIQRFNNRKNLQSALRSLVEALRGNKDDKIMSALYGVRFALFIPVHGDPRQIEEPALNPEFVFESGGYGFCRQHDGTTLISEILGALEYSVPVVVSRTVSHAGTLLTFPGKAEESSVLKLTMPLRVARAPLCSFQDLLTFNYNPKHTRDSYRPMIGESRIPFEEFHEQTRIAAAPPEHLFFQILRFQFIDESYRKEFISVEIEKQRKEYGALIMKGLKKEKPTETIEKNEKRAAEVLKDRAEFALGVVGGQRKINEPVLFPRDGIVDLALAFGSEVPLPYQIASFEVHHGETPAGGHYTTYMRHDDGSWYHHNDEKVTLVANPRELESAFGGSYNVCVKRFIPAPAAPVALVAGVPVALVAGAPAAPVAPAVSVEPTASAEPAVPAPEAPVAPVVK